MAQTKVVINNIYSQIKDLSDRDVIKALDNELSYFVQGYAFMRAYKNGWFNPQKGKWERWDGKSRLLKKDLIFLTGFLSRVYNILKAFNIEYKIIDKRTIVPFGPKIKLKGVQKREYQDEVLQKALENQGGMIKSATGSGKSIMIAQLIANTNVKTIVYVIGIDLLYQMHDTLTKTLGRKVGIIGDGHADIKKINVCTLWTASAALGKKYKKFDDEDCSKKEKIKDTNKIKIKKAIGSSQMLIFDESQFVATTTAQNINSESKNAVYKYGFSATPFREDNADLLLEGVCGSGITDISASYLIKNNYLVKPIIYFDKVPPLKKNLSSNYHSVYKNYIVENSVRNNKIIKVVQKLVEKKRKVLLLVKNINHGEILLSKLEDDFVVYFIKGDVNSDERERVKNEFSKGNVDIIIASSVFDQGIDLPIADALVLAGSGKSSNRALQRVGRIIRVYPNKKNAIVVDFLDNVKYLSKHSKKRLDTYRLEEEFDIRLPDAKSKKKKKKSKRLQKPSW